MVLGEGAGAIVLESLETAQARARRSWAKCWAAVRRRRWTRAAWATCGPPRGAACGRRCAAPGSHPAAVEPRPRTWRRDAPVGCGRGPGDPRGVRRSHGPVPVVAAKSYLGNAGAACGVLELIASVLALQHDRLFPVLNYETPDEQCPVPRGHFDRRPAGRRVRQSQRDSPWARPVSLACLADSREAAHCAQLQLDTSEGYLYPSGTKITLSCDFRTCSSDFRSQNPLPEGVGRFLDAPCAGPADMAALALQGVSKVFAGPVPAVQDLDLEIRDQELVVLVGPSGCGKTTTLRLIAGLEDPDRGVIRIRWPGGQSNGATRSKHRHGVSTRRLVPAPDGVPEHGGGFAVAVRWRVDPTMLDAMASSGRGAAAEQMRRQAIARQVQDAAGILGIEHLLDRMPRQLSGGECQRVALGRAIVRRPAAFLLDEPLSHLDAQLRVAMRRELKRLHQRVRDDHGVRHARPGGGLGAGRPNCGDASRADSADGIAAGGVRATSECVGGRIPGFTGNELDSGPLAAGRPSACDLSRAAWIVSLPADAARPERPAGRHPVTLGIRPEHLWLREDRRPSGTALGGPTPTGPRR